MNAYFDLCIIILFNKDALIVDMLSIKDVAGALYKDRVFRCPCKSVDTKM